MAKRKRYSKKERDLIFEMKETKHTLDQISEALAVQGFDRSEHQIANYLYYHSKKLPRIKTTLPPEYDRAVAKLDELKSHVLDFSKDHFITVGQTDGVSKKVLILTDLHIPFELPHVISHAMKHHGDADVLILGGDLIECHSVSAFRKGKALLFRREYEQAMEYVKLFAGMFPTVILVSGNHERRLQRYVSDNLGNMLRGLVQDDPLAAMANGMDYDDSGQLVKTYHFPNVIYEGFPRADYTRVGKLIVAHPNNYSTVPMRTVVNVAEALLDIEDFQCVVMGHTHAQGRLVWRNRLLIEAGCCCEPMEYTFATGRMAKLPQTFGYVVAHLDDKGNVNFDKTRSVYRGVGKITKKETITDLEKR